MISIINGGIYRVEFDGKSSSEFVGLHPALIVRTLKEEELYFVVPLTTYTKDKMDSIKKNGAGVHFKSINSIARVDKIQIIHNRSLKGRWLGSDGTLKITPEELANVNKKVNEYTKLSFDKAEKEYGKYRNQYDIVMGALKELYETKASNDICSLTMIGGKVQIEYAKANLSNISTADYIEIVKNVFGLKNVTMDSKGSVVKINEN